MGISEDNFPRGGSTLSEVKKLESNISLFGSKQGSSKPKPTKKQRKKIALAEGTARKVDSEITAKSAEALSYKSICDGMTILGCIHKVNEMGVQISLPGRTYGFAMITNISSPYTNLLQKMVQNSQTSSKPKTLNNMFKSGQYVCTKVLSPDDTNTHNVNLSLSPTDTHAGIKHTDVIKDSVHMAAVQSIEEHGYVMDLGVANCRAFLDSKELPPENGILGIGELIWCSVSKVLSTPSVTTVNLTAVIKKLEKSAVTGDNVSLHRILPGMTVEATVDKLLPNGLQVKFLQNFYGYVSESHLQQTNHEVRNYAKGQVVQAIVLYVMPVSKLTYLTMRPLKAIVPPSNKIKIGDIASGKVVSKSGKGIYIKLSNNARGFITYKRIKSKGITDSNELAMKYSKGTTLSVRILSFDFMDNVYICSNEQDILKQKIFSINDLEPGQLVSATIENVTSKGLFVKVGCVPGIVTSLHVTDIPVNNASISLRFKPQQAVRCRVLTVDQEKQQLYLTMKSGLLDQAIDIVSNYKEIKQGKRCRGTIVQILANGILVVFFNNVKGFVPKSQFNFQNVNDPRDAYFIGQVVDCTVLWFDLSSLRLTLTLKNYDNEEQKIQISLGDRVSGIVKRITSCGLYVMVGNTQCLLPLMHLTQQKGLGEVILGTYKTEDTIPNLICVKSDARIPVLSLYEGCNVYEDPQGEEDTTDVDMEGQPILDYPILDFKDVKKDTLLKGWVHNTEKNRILMQCPITNFKRFAVVHAADLLDNPVEDLNALNLVQHQSLILKVLSVDRKKQNITCSAKLSNVWDHTTKPSVDILMSYLHGVNIIKEHWKLSGKSMSNLTIGQRVQGTVKELCSDKVVLELPDNVQAVSHVQHSSGTLQINDSVLCLVLWLDFINNVAEVSFDKKIINRINEVQDADKNLSALLGSTARCEVLLVKEDFVLGILRGAGLNHIAFLPTRVHSNDLLPVMDDYTEKKIHKVTLIAIKNGHAVCVLKDRLTAELKYAKHLAATCKRRRGKTSTSDIDTGNSNQLTKNSTNSETEMEEEMNVMPAKVNEKVSSSHSKQNAPKRKCDENKTITPPKKIKKDEKLINRVSHDTKLTSKDSEPVCENDLSSKTNKKYLQNACVSKKTKNDNKVDTKVEDSEEEVDEEEKCHDNGNNDDKGGLLGASDFFLASVDNLRPAIDSSSSSDESEEETDKVKRKKKLTILEKQTEMRKEEEALHKNELDLAQSYQNPQTADHFDRVLLANPNDSLTWINYMAYHLQATEIEKARAVARKALSSISFRDEQEKMNVWIAFLNLENSYGTKETFSEVLEEALRMNDARSVHMQAIQILAESSKVQDMMDLINKSLKKYKSIVETWVNAGLACFKAGLVEKARQIMQKGLGALENKHHIDLIIRFSGLENRFEHSERAQALIEQVLTSYPRRVDIWSQYVDMLVKSSQISIARDVLSRAVSQKLPARKMKTLFKKFLDFESKFGDEDSTTKVREMAAEYVKNATN